MECRPSSAVHRRTQVPQALSAPKSVPAAGPAVIPPKKQREEEAAKKAAEEAAAKAADKRAVVEVNRQFHFVVYGMAKMDMLFSQIESLWVAMGPIMNVLYDEAAFAFGTGKQHTSLLKALKAGDGAAARNAVERDIIENGKPILQLIERLEG